MIRITKNVFLSGLLCLGALHLANADVARWSFTERAGTGLSNAADRAGGFSFDGGATGVSTDGDGALRVRRSLAEPVVRNAELESIGNGRVYLDVTFGGWHLEQEPGESIRIGFAEGADWEGLTVALDLTRIVESKVWIRAEADGTGSMSAPLDVFLPRVQPEPVRLVLECDLDRSVYEIHRRMEDGEWISLGRGALAEDRAVRFLSIEFANLFNDTEEEFLTIREIAVTRHDPLGRGSDDGMSEPPFVTAWSWAVADADTGEILGSHGLDTPRKSASVTKAMTTFIVCELARENPAVLEERIVFSELAVQATGSTANIDAGESLTVRDALFAFMLPSGNAVGNAIAEHFNDRFDPAPGAAASSHPRARFIAEMNRAAARLGMTNTTYRSAFGDGGTPDDRTTTARDQLLLARAAMADPLFREVVGTAAYSADVTRADGTVRRASWNNTNQFLTRELGYDGIKTGTTRFARACLLSSAEMNGRRLHAVVLGSNHSSRRYVDTHNLMVWASQLPASTTANLEQ